MADVFLGAGILYVILWVPLPLASAALLGAVPVLGTLWLLREHRGLRRESWTRLGNAMRHWPHRWSALGTGILTLAVLVLETYVVLTAPAGNTLDAANATLWTALLVHQGHFGLTLGPYGSYPVYQPQGMTVWFAATYLVGEAPLWSAANTTAPLLQAMVVPAFAAVGRRWWRAEAAPVAFAAVAALLLAWPRMLVQGSYDFVAAVPLALLILPWLPDVVRGRSAAGNASPFPMVALLAALDVTYSPVPLEALGAGLGLAGVVLLLVRVKEFRAGLRRLARCVAIPVVAAVGALPSLVVIAMTSPGRATVLGPPGTTLALGDLPSLLDPFLFSDSNIWVSPFPLLHVEFIVLLLAGVGMLLFRERWFTGASGDDVVLTLLVPLLGSAVLLLLMTVPVGPLYAFSNASELVLLFVIAEGLLVALPAGLLVSRVARPAPRAGAPEGGERRRSPRRPATWGETGIPLGVVVVVLIAMWALPVAESVTEEPPYLVQELRSVSNVSTVDIAMLQEFASLPPGAVLAAPGSAAEYLPAFSTDPLIYPAIGVGGGLGFQAGFSNGQYELPFSGPLSNTTYLAIATELVTGNLSSDLGGKLAVLHVRYVAVTGNSTGLFPAFLPGPMLRETMVFGAPVWHEGPDYIIPVLPA